MKLIVGLGNPGRQYEQTRHNVGFQVLDEVARRCGAGKPKKKFAGKAVEVSIHGETSLLLCPQTYMNCSGRSVQPAVAFFRLSVDNLLVVCDDFNLPLAKLRFRAKGSAGGQKGLADIIRCLGTEEFARLRVGIGLPEENRDAVGHVLSRFRGEESAEIQRATVRAADAVMDWVRWGIDECMNVYN